jgi:hypothetical protein
MPYVPAAALWVNYFLLSQLSWLGFGSLLGYISIGLAYCECSCIHAQLAVQHTMLVFALYSNAQLQCE